MFQELADQQGVAPVDNFEALLGRPSPDDESAEAFAVRLRQWRREGTGSDSPR
jgi:serine/threonine protein kinase HipA of HipAB toxin-antitoxin module